MMDPLDTTKRDTQSRRDGAGLGSHRNSILRTSGVLYINVEMAYRQHEIPAMASRCLFYMLLIPTGAIADLLKISMVIR